MKKLSDQEQVEIVDRYAYNEEARHKKKLKELIYSGYMRDKALNRYLSLSGGPLPFPINIKTARNFPKPRFLKWLLTGNV